MGRENRIPFRGWFVLAIAAATFSLVAAGAWLWALAIVATTYAYCLFHPKRETARAPDRPREIHSILWDFTGPESLLAFSVPFFPVHSMFSQYDTRIAIMMSGLCFLPLLIVTGILLAFLPVASVRIVKTVEDERIIHRFVVFTIDDNVKMRFLWQPDGDGFLVAAHQEYSCILYHAELVQQKGGARFPGGTIAIGQVPSLRKLEYERDRSWLLPFWNRLGIDPSECSLRSKERSDLAKRAANYKEEADLFFGRTLVLAKGFPNLAYLNLTFARVYPRKWRHSLRQHCDALVEEIPHDYPEYAKLLKHANEIMETMEREGVFASN